jgi:putative selenate reductase
MAQNIALAWLAGARILELKTVQINDRLTIPRPCIDATNVVYNVEWSQELTLEESLYEYVKGSMLVDVLREMEALGPAPSPGRDATILDMSVGYDLAGIRSPRVRAWMEAVRDAREHVETVRRQIPADLARWRDLDFRTALSDQVTLSTFHGCPADEIESIARFLLDEMDLHVTVKLNPTLLGRDTVDGLLHESLGYTEVETRPEDFEKDLQWAQALEMVDRLTEAAQARDRTFAVKLTNTLVVRNHRAFFPAGEEVMYLSGQPLHVLTLHLLQRFREQRPELPISFSAVVDSRNFPDCVALGLVPVTVCSDLLRPGGYGRLPRYLNRLEEKMRELGVSRLGDYIVKTEGTGEEVLRAVVEPGALRDELLSSLGGERVDLLGPLERASQADLYPRLVREAARLNTASIVERAASDPRYKADANRRTPKKIGSHLSLFDCVNCDKCVPACPNDANFAYETEPLSAEAPSYRVDAGEVVVVAADPFEVKERHQLAVFQDFCNDCGNCDTFCPEDGGPYVEKPRFFGTLEGWRRRSDRDGFFVAGNAEGLQVQARVKGREYTLEVEPGRTRAVFGDGFVRLEVDHRRRRVERAVALPGAPEGHVLELSAYLATALAVDGVVDTARANPVNSGLATPDPGVER